MSHNYTTKAKDREWGSLDERFSKEVRRKDGYACVVCKSKSNLHAHHLDGYAWHPNKRYDVENGVTLCRKCHLEFHEWNGGIRIKCTKDLFYDWLLFKELGLTITDDEKRLDRREPAKKGLQRQDKRNVTLARSRRKGKKRVAEDKRKAIEERNRKVVEALRIAKSKSTQNS